MRINRRTFLTAAAAAGTTLAGSGGIRAADAAGPDLPDFDARDPERFWSSVRSQFPLAPDFTYFNTGGLGPTATPVLRVVAATTERLQLRSEHGHNLIAGARDAVARFLGAEPAEIAFVRNATEGNAIVAAGLKLAPEDEVIFETHAHPGGSYPWHQQRSLRGIVVKTFEPDTADAGGNVRRIQRLLTRRTRVVQVSQVTAPTGIVMPVQEIARVCRERGIWFHVDGAQSAGMIPVSVRQLGCDSFATSGHKWLGGPHETGVLWVRRDRLDDVAPTLVGAYSGEIDVTTGGFQLDGTAVRYEYGTRSAAAVLGLAEAVRFQQRIGRERIAARGRDLVARVRDGLGRIRGVEILTPRAIGMSAAMITFRSATIPHDQLFSRLLRDHGIRARPVTEEKLNALRVSAHVFNSPAECDALVRALGAFHR